MERTVNLLVCTSLTDAQMERVRLSDRRVRVSDAAALLVREIADALRPGQPEPAARKNERTLDELFADAEVILGARRMPRDLAKRAPKVRWVQMPLAGLAGTGVEHLWELPDVTVTSAAGANAASVAEFALLASMMLLKDARRLLASHDAHRWDRYDLGLLRGKTFAILGYGTVGRHIARLAEPFGVRLLALKRQVSADEGLPGWVYPSERLDWMLEQADVLVLALPATPATKGMLGARQFSLLRQGAVLVNVARGDILDDAALVEALREGRLGGAALDVFNEEPLPPDSPFWSLPNTLVTGHVAGLSPGFDDAVLDIFLENLRRYLEGKPLINAIDRRTGY